MRQPKPYIFPIMKSRQTIVMLFPASLLLAGLLLRPRGA